MYDLIVVGHLTHDITETPQGTRILLGGSAAYTSIVASRLGLKVGLVSRVGKDFREDYLNLLEGEGIDLRGLHIGNTVKATSFKNRYTASGRREQHLTQLCEEIRAEDIPNSYLDARCFHFGPIFHEIPYTLVERVKERSILTSLDLQGYCRRAVAGMIIPSSPGRDEMETISHMDILKGSGEEVSLTAGRERVEEALEEMGRGSDRIVIATLSEEGSLFYYRGVLKRIPPYPSVKTIDPTGSGDAYMAGFLARYMESGNPYTSALYASCVASFIVEDFGFKGTPSPEMVEERMKENPFPDPV